MQEPEFKLQYWKNKIKPNFLSSKYVLMLFFCLVFYLISSCEEKGRDVVKCCISAWKKGNWQLARAALKARPIGLAGGWSWGSGEGPVVSHMGWVTFRQRQEGRLKDSCGYHGWRV
jgi:hypothetical protein